MSTLISSAAPGKKAAPKAPPRRRPAGGPPPPPPSQPKAALKPVEQSVEQPTNESVASDRGSVSGAPPPTPPPTQQPSAQHPTEPQHVRFAEPVTIPEKAPQSVPARLEPPTATPATQESPASELPSSRTVIADPPPPQPQSALQQQAPTPSQDSVRGGTRDATPPPVASIESEPTAQPESPQVAKRAREPDTTEPQTRKAPKRNSTRSNATVQAQVENGTVPGPSQTPRRPPVARMMATIQDSADESTMPDADDAGAQQNGEVDQPKKAPAKRKVRKVKTPARVNEEEPQEGEAGPEPAPKPKKPRKPRQKRAPAKSKSKSATEGGEGDDGNSAEGANAAQEEPESDPEQHEIDPEALSMYNITKHKRYGKTSERERKMAEIDWDEVKRKRHLEAAGEAPPEPPATVSERKDQEGDAATQEESSNKQEPQSQTRAVQGGLGFRVVNGEIVEDEDTLQIDRRAQAQAEIAMQAPIEEENDLTRFHNRATYLNDRKRDEKDRVPAWKSKSDPWSEDETDRFYDALKNWGTDFQIISQLFPAKNRAQIKKKFNREERIDADRVNAALLGKDPVRMDLKAYAEAANLDVAEFNKFESLEHAQSIISESMRDKEEAMRIAVKEAEETERQRAVQEAQRKKGRDAAESRKKLTQAKKAARSRGQVWGTGTFGGFGGGDDEGGE
ncbi:hypothetical protein Q7P37_005238 [Cladosporium fusiforme]